MNPLSSIGVRVHGSSNLHISRRVPRCSIETGEWRETKKRSVVVLPGLGNAKGDYAALAAALGNRGLAVEIADVRRIDWLRNARGVIDINYWRGTLNPRPTVDWYLKLVGEAVDRAKQATDGAPVTLLAHSAGGWLSRLYLLNFGTLGIDRLVTLGSPHQPPPKVSWEEAARRARGTQDSPIPDQTRGILTFVRESCPANYHPEVQYVSVAGKYIKGAKIGDREASLLQQAIGAGYQAVCGVPDVWGDGVVPLPAAHLEGAEQVTLEGVYHSPVGSDASHEEAGENGQASGNARPRGRPWYGSPGVLELWLSHVADESELVLDQEQPSAQVAAHEAGFRAAEEVVGLNAAASRDS